MKEKSRSKISCLVAFIRIFGFSMMLLASGLPLAAANKGNEFDSLCGVEGIECTYISGRFSDSYQSWGRLNLGILGRDIDRNFKALYTYDAMTEGPVNRVRTLLKKYLSENKDLELVMKNISQYNEYYIYQQLDRQQQVKQILIWSCDGKVYGQLVIIDY